jgi:hypothetical protein
MTSMSAQLTNFELADPLGIDDWQRARLFYPHHEQQQPYDDMNHY